MIAIVTKTLPATDTRGCRLVATAPARDRKRVVLPYDYSASNWENHVAVAELYVNRHLAGAVKRWECTAQSGLNQYTSIYG